MPYNSCSKTYFWVKYFDLIDFSTSFKYFQLINHREYQFMILIIISFSNSPEYGFHGHHFREEREKRTRYNLSSSISTGCFKLFLFNRLLSIQPVLRIQMRSDPFPFGGSGSASWNGSGNYVAKSRRNKNRQKLQKYHIFFRNHFFV